MPKQNQNKPETKKLTSKGTNTRDRILETARQRLIAGGYDELVLREVAEQLEIKLGNLQYYFKTKEVLTLEVLEEEAKKDLDVIQRSQDTDPTQRFRNIVSDLVARWRGDSGVLFSILGTLALHNPSFKKLHQQIYQSFYKALSEPVRELNADIDEEQLTTKVRLITALIDGSPMQIRVGNLQNYLQKVQSTAESIALN